MNTPDQNLGGGLLTDGEGSHINVKDALGGLAQEVELALAADVLPAAQVALATMEADFPEEVPNEAAWAYFVLVAGEDALPARTAPTPIAAKATSAEQGAQAEGFVLHSAYPNPFNPQTQIRYDVADASRVHIAVFDLLGREIAVLVDGFVEPGTFGVAFDGSGFASGLYLLHATSEPESGNSSQTFTRRITLLK